MPEIITEPITPDWKPHTSLEQHIKVFCECCGFMTFSLPYHEFLDDELKQLVSLRYSSAALYLRGRSDKFAIHCEGGDDFEWEAKTHSSKDRWDMTLEALPLAAHMSKWKTHEADTLYCHYDERAGHRGFMVSWVPPIKVIMIPLGAVGSQSNWSDEGRSYFERVCGRVFPDARVIQLNKRVRGSGDPFVIIDEQEKLKLADWRDLILERMP